MYVGSLTGPAGTPAPGMSGSKSRVWGGFRKGFYKSSESRLWGLGRGSGLYGPKLFRFSAARSEPFALNLEWNPVLVLWV